MLKILDNLFYFNHNFLRFSYPAFFVVTFCIFFFLPLFSLFASPCHSVCFLLFFCCFFFVFIFCQWNYHVLQLLFLIDSMSIISNPIMIVIQSLFNSMHVSKTGRCPCSKFLLSVNIARGKNAPILADSKWLYWVIYLS